MMRFLSNAAALAAMPAFGVNMNKNAGSMMVLPEHCPKHMKWDVTDEGLIEARANPLLHINVVGGKVESGKGLVLWHCQPKDHEKFFLDGTQIRLTHNPELCLNVEGGIAKGNKIITFPCGSGQGVVPAEEFVVASGLVKLKHSPDLCVSVREGEMRNGGRIEVSQCKEDSQHHLFQVDGHKFRMQSAPHLNLNVAFGDIQNKGASLVLWGCNGDHHEVLEYTQEGRFRFKAHPEVCLNAQGGVALGNYVIAYTCHEQPVDSELWTWDRASGLIVATKRPDLGFGIQEANIQPGSSIVLERVEKVNEL